MEAEFILESFNEYGEYKPHLFIFKNGETIMLTEMEIIELKEVIESI